LILLNCGLALLTSKQWGRVSNPFDKLPIVRKRKDCNYVGMGSRNWKLSFIRKAEAIKGKWRR